MPRTKFDKNNEKEPLKDERTRNWTFIVYPESAPDDWREIIDNEHVPWVESPLHDKDLNPDGEMKKAHWHVMVMYSSKKTLAQIQELTDKLNSPIPQKVSNAKGMVRYFAHLDNPEKYQYSKSEIIAHCGADIGKYLATTTAQRYELIKEMSAWVNETGCVEFSELFEYAASERFDDWFPLLCDNSAYVIGQYIKSKRHGGRATKTIVKVDQNGEIQEN